MSSAIAFARSSAVPCTHCGPGPSQSFRTEPTHVSLPVLTNQLHLPSTSFRQISQKEQVPKWQEAFGSSGQGARKGVRMEYGGKAMRPRLVKEGKREMISGGQMLQRLRKQLLEAINTEDYSTAAQVRDFISIVVRQDPVLSARQALERAVSEERYDDAAKLRDELKDMIPPEKDNHFVLGHLDNSSNTCTKDIRVRVKSGYVVERSNPSRQQYFFAYRIRISNEGTRTVQLVNRHWTITDATGRTDEVRGPGVIGEQPVLRAGNEFEYTSACPLRTPAGKMEGEYQMIHVDSDDPAPFAVAIGPFALRVEDDEEEGVAFQ